MVVFMGFLYFYKRYSLSRLLFQKIEMVVYCVFLFVGCRFELSNPLKSIDVGFRFVYSPQSDLVVSFEKNASSIKYIYQTTAKDYLQKVPL